MVVVTVLLSNYQVKRQPVTNHWALHGRRTFSVPHVKCFINHQPQTTKKSNISATFFDHLSLVVPSFLQLWTMPRCKLVSISPCLCYCKSRGGLFSTPRASNASSSGQTIGFTGTLERLADTRLVKWQNWALYMRGMCRIYLTKTTNNRMMNMIYRRNHVHDILFFCISPLLCTGK